MGVYPVVLQKSTKAGTIPIQAFEEVKHRYMKEAIAFPLSPDGGMGMKIHLLNRVPFPMH
jgi:hypothetical protein